MSILIPMRHVKYLCLTYDVFRRHETKVFITKAILSDLSLLATTFVILCSVVINVAIILTSISLTTLR